jgi:TolA-binding protein
MNPSLSQAAGAAIRETVDVNAPAGSHAGLRARFVEAGERAPARQPVVWLAFPAAAVLAVLLVVIGVRRGLEDKAVTYRVGPDHAPGAMGVFVTPAAGNDLSLEFSEGSRITLEQGAHGRVVAATPRGASLVLETGRARLDVVHRARSEWSVAAGPYTVSVTGTSFDVNWIASTSTIEVQVAHGSVVVRGPGADSGVEVKDSQRFVATASARFEERPATAVSDLPLVASGEAAPAPPPSNAAADAGSQGPAAASWPELAARGEYRQIVADAESRGIDAAVASAGEADLSTLADAARYTGRGEVARKALTAIRTRFPRSARATSAAFVLGRMSEDAGNVRAAIGWYDSYLAEAPGGALAAEAMGRRMVALRRAGQTGEARRAAEAYLARFPGGAYAGVAHEMVSP